LFQSLNFSVGMLRNFAEWTVRRRTRAFETLGSPEEREREAKAVFEPKLDLESIRQAF